MGNLHRMINLDEIEAYDNYLDNSVSFEYKDQPLAQDWARISKVAEELGEAIQNFISYTGQNPRKEVRFALDEVLKEMADVAGTAILCIQHFTKNKITTEQYIAEFSDKLRKYRK
jgi:hypothetical protein